MIANYYSEEIPEQIGNRIRQARRRLGISEQQLADYLGEPYDRIKIAKIELGMAKLTVIELYCLADALEVCPCWLLREHPFNSTDD